MPRFGAARHPCTHVARSPLGAGLGECPVPSQMRSSGAGLRQNELFGELDGHVGSAWSGGLLAAILSLEGIGRVGALELIKACPDPRAYEILEVSSKVSVRLAGFLPKVLPEPLEPIEGVRVVGLGDDDYPSLLRHIPVPPPVLWVRGTIPTEPFLAVVGTRHPSPFGRGAARSAARAAVDEGFAVVSGLALGVDTVAHEGTIESGGVTVAVLGGDVRDPQPKANRHLADGILETGGALVSEVQPGRPFRIDSRHPRH